MLYQLSYASTAQTEQDYHHGNEIASGFAAPGKAAANFTPNFPSLLVRPTYCTADFENWLSGISTLWRTSPILMINVEFPLVW